jgi:hypothetical protein
MKIQAAVAFKRIDKYMNADEIDTEAVSHDDNEGKDGPFTQENFTHMRSILS